MESTISFAIAGLFLLATISFMIAETRLTYAAFGGVALLTAINGEAIVDGVLLTVLFSPALLILVPAARRLKKRGALGPAGGPARAASARPSVTASAPPAPQPDPKAREAEARRRAEARNRAMIERLEVDPVSAVLRRQVPVRFGEEPRSWLGGLPMMPEDVPWPHGGPEQRHLNFMAQIACADLPDRLWRGQGPREGWLLLFVEAMSMDGIDEMQARILHIDRLGPERRPPDDLAPVHNTHYVGPDYWQPQEDIPTLWRKWPIDIFEQHQEIEGGQVISFIERDFAPRPTTSEELYGIKQTETLPRLDASVSPPRTWAAAADYLSMLILWACEQAGKDPSDLTARLRDGEGWLGHQIALAETEIAELSAGIDEKLAEAEALKAQAEEAAAREAEAEENGEQAPIETGIEAEDAEAEMPESERLEGQRRNALAWAEKMSARLVLEKETLSHLSEYSDEDGEARLENEIQASVAGMPGWWAALDGPLTTMRDAIAEQDRDAELPDEVWSEITSVLSQNMQVTTFRRGYRGRDKTEALRQETLSLNAVKPWGEAIMREHYLDLYTTSPKTRALIPGATLERVEEITRAISWDRPHRMGGLADPLQDDIGPDSPPLLFQIASDTGMNWMWGDAGAIYIGTSDDELAARRFNGTLRVECH